MSDITATIKARFFLETKALGHLCLMAQLYMNGEKLGPPQLMIEEGDFGVTAEFIRQVHENPPH